MTTKTTDKTTPKKAPASKPAQDAATATTTPRVAKPNKKAATTAPKPKAATRAKDGAKSKKAMGEAALDANLKAIAGAEQGKGKAPRAKVPAKASADAKPRGILACAAQILADAKQPMNCQEIVKVAIDSGMWASSGKTPAATLHAAIGREIRAKGKEGRFVKAERGRYAANAKA